MAKRKSRHQTALLAKLLWLDVLVVGAMSLLSIGLSARYSVKLLEDGLVQNLGNVAKMLATSEQVRDALEKGLVSPGLDRYLRDVIADQNNVDVITLADMKAIRIFHPEPDRIGETFYGGDEGPVLKGEIYSSKARGTLGYQMRYFYPVYGNDGRQIGFVHVSMLMSNLTKLRDNVLIVQLQTLAVVLVLGAVAAALISMSIKRSLLGFEPGQIADIFLRRGEILDSLAEGLLAVDEAGKIILINDAAQAMLGLEKEAAQERDVDNFFPQLRIKEAITQPQSPAESASEDSCFRRLSVAIN
ncbi:MAG: PAS domain-containing protein, partial [Deltaproteobacteria bacterium]|nr:PAS domain-containing protein [Deltaproteobacteria bacterium]